MAEAAGALGTTKTSSSHACLSTVAPHGIVYVKARLNRFYECQPKKWIEILEL